MKKIFTLFAAMLFALTASARTWTVGPNHNEESDRTDCNLYVTIERLAVAGDTLLLADGEYAETLTFPVNNNIYVVAEAGARPVIKMSGYFNTFASVKFKGITFDHTAVETNSYLIYLQAGCDSVVLEDCEITGFRDGGIMSWAAYDLTKLRMNNCYCHDNKKSIVYLTNNQCRELEITNSTFASNEGSPSYVENGWSAGIIDIRNTGTAEANQKVRVDHCTFYNNSTKNYDYADVKSYKSTDVVVSNCIFYGPSSTYDGRATHLYGGEVKNCLTINYAHETAGHRTGGATFSDTILNRDPLFVDAANGNFVLGEGSPALTAGTDGKAIGDPHWASSRTLYLKPNGNWKSNDAKFAVNGYGSGHGSLWSGFMTLVDGTSDIYTTTIPVGFDKVIFTRQDKDASSPSWNSKWNQSKNMAIEEPADFCVIEGDAWDGAGSWYRFGITLSGDMNSWSKVSDPLVADGDDYKITINLATGDYEFKLIDHGDYRANGWWFKRDATTATGIAADGNNMKIEADRDGDYTITWTRATGTLSVTFPTTTAIDNTLVGEKAVKRMENGQIVIIKNGVRYNVLGTVIK